MIGLVRGFSYTPHDSYRDELYTPGASFSKAIFMSVLVRSLISYIFHAGSL